jgi:ketosteroid isomerase-like protein
MTNAVPRDRLEAFYRVYAAHDTAGVAAFLADDVEWTISGPVDLLPFCGTRRGKAAVLDLIGNRIIEVFRVASFVRDQTLIDGERVATLNRLTAHSPDGRVISYRLAHFMQFRDGLIVENVSLIDSFDAVEQVVGHPLNVPEAPPLAGGDDGVAL